MHVLLTIFFCFLFISGIAQKRARDHGIHIGLLPTGTMNAITDVAGVHVGHTTITRDGNVRTGVTAIPPHSGNLFQQKVPAAIYVANGFGKLAGISQVKELGNIESPVILTNTLNVATAINAVTDYTLLQPGNENLRSVNAVVGETNDGGINDIRGRHVTGADVLNAIATASGGRVEEGNVGAGNGTVAFGFKGGIGTASRKLPASLGGYTLGVLVQSNFGGVLQINGVPVGEALRKHYLLGELSKKEDGSCMIVVATDAPLDSRNLERLAMRAFMGLAKTGGIAHNGSGDYVIAFSTDSALRVPHQPNSRTYSTSVLTNDSVSPLFLAAIEATEEAIINSLFAAATVTSNGITIEALPVEKVLGIMKQYKRLEQKR